MPTHPRFHSIRACVFDAYGTLFDVHSAVGQHRSALGAHADRVSIVWRTKQLEYTWLRSLMGHHADFWQVTADALDFALDTVELDDPDLRDRLLDAYLRLDAYPEVPVVLDRLRAAGLTTAILSNGTPAMLRAAVDSAGLTAAVDHILSVESVGVFKPDPRVYRLAVDHLGVPPDQVSFQSANAWDASGAAAFGFRVAWINRFGQRRERLPFGADAELSTLAELPALLGLDTN